MDPRCIRYDGAAQSVESVQDLLMTDLNCFTHLIHRGLHAASAHVQPSCRLPFSEIIWGDQGGSQTSSTLTFSSPSYWPKIASRTSSVRYECMGQAGVVMVITMRTL